MTLFLSVTIIKIADGTFGIEAVVSGLAVHLPIAAATAGTLSMPLAVLGVLKLAAAAELLGNYALQQQGKEEEGYAPVEEHYSPSHFYRSFRKYRNKRQVPVQHTEAIFGLVSSMDLYSCGKALICGLQAKDQRDLAQDEQLLMTLFGDRKAKHEVNPGSAKAEYDLAAELGLATKDQVACRKRYSTCPYTSDEMMTALRESQL